MTNSCWLTDWLSGPLWSYLICLRLASPCAPGTMHHLCHPHLLFQGDWADPHVCRPNGLRAYELDLEADNPGRKTRPWVISSSSPSSSCCLAQPAHLHVHKVNADSNIPCWVELQGRGYGMPSSHSQYVAFFSAYICLFLLIRHVPSKRTSPDSSPATFSQRLIVSVLACAGATLVIYSRVYLRYHTKKQVLVGAALGVGFAIAWFVFTKCLRSLGLLDSVLDCELARLARVRDLMTTEDFAEAGWVRWRRDRERSRREKDVNGNGRKNI